MKRLYAPWRSTYTEDTARTKNEGVTEADCIFCNQLKEDNDEKHFIVKRFEHNFILLNRFPYNAGHILILPFVHVTHLHELTKDVRTELIELASQSAQMLQTALQSHGTNFGINIGKAAGAGIPAHVHMHVLPRFTGDTNFLPVLADTKTISFDLQTMYNRLKLPLEKIKI